MAKICPRNYAKICSMSLSYGKNIAQNLHPNMWHTHGTFNHEFVEAHGWLCLSKVEYQIGKLYGLPPLSKGCFRDGPTPNNKWIMSSNWSAMCSSTAILQMRRCQDQCCKWWYHDMEIVCITGPLSGHRTLANYWPVINGDTWAPIQYKYVVLPVKEVPLWR